MRHNLTAVFLQRLRVQSESCPHEDNDEGCSPERGSVVWPRVLELQPWQVLQNDAGEQHTEQRRQLHQFKELVVEERE